MNDTTRTNEDASVADFAFQREAYISLADEFDPMGADPNAPDPTVDEFDPTYVAAAREYAARHTLPLPWELRSVDIALDYVRSAERDPR